MDFIFMEKYQMKKYEILSERFVWSSVVEDIKFRIDDNWGIDTGPSYITFKTVDGILHKVPLYRIDDIRIEDND